jgi:5-bromo-4-chloroindolyl phosphate hydrolysis protein
MTTMPAVPSVDTTPVPAISGTKTEQTDASQSEWDIIRAQLRESPLNPDDWLKLVELAEDSGDLEKIKETYEALLQTYPNTVRNLFRRVLFHLVLNTLAIFVSLALKFATLITSLTRHLSPLYRRCSNVS